MRESPGNTGTSQQKKLEKSFWVKLQDFMTGTSGLITSLAAIIVAISTIVGVALHGSSQPSPTVPAAPRTAAASPQQTGTPQAGDTSARAAPVGDRVGESPVGPDIEFDKCF